MRVSLLLRIVWLLLLFAAPAGAVQINQLPEATVPLAGTEPTVVFQNGKTAQVPLSPANIGAAGTATSNAYSAAQAVTPVTLIASAGVFAWDARASNTFILTLGAANSIGNPTNLKAGQVMVFAIHQDNVGNRTISSWGSDFLFSQGAAPTLTTAANAEDVVSCASETPTRLLCVFQNNFITP